MKIIKNMLVVIMIVIIVFVITNTNAYTGGVVDAGDEIALPSFLINGNGTVEISTSLTNGKMYYQFVEINKEKYDKIRKMKDELIVGEYFLEYEDNPTDDNYDKYASARAYYKSQYGEELTNFRPAHLEDLRDQIIGNLPDYTNDWILTSNNIINIDLSSFYGTKYYTSWVKVVNGDRTVYDAQIYNLTGTKTNTEDQNNTDTNSGVIDAGDEIEMPFISMNGTGKVILANNITNYQMYYQINEIENSKYKEIRKLKDELIVAEYFAIYEENQTDDNYDNYASARAYYKSQYGEELTNFRPDHIDELRDQIKGLLPKYTEDWILTTNDIVDSNLSSFSGTKDFVIWVKVVSGDRTIYDGDIYELTGTKKEEEPTEPDDNNKNEEQPTEPDDNNKNEEQPTEPDDNNKNEEQPTEPDNNNKNEEQPTEPDDNNNNEEQPTVPDDNNNNEEQPTEPDDNNKNEEQPTEPDNNNKNEEEPTEPDNNNKNEEEPTTPDDNNKNEEQPTESDNNKNNEEATPDDNSKNEEESTTQDKNNNKNNESNYDENQKQSNEQTSTVTDSKSLKNIDDSTTSNKKLPYTGNSNMAIIVAIIMAMASSIIAYIKLRKQK